MDEEFSVAIAEYSYSNEQLAFILFFFVNSILIVDDSDGGSARATTIINIFLPLYMIFGQFVCSSAAIRIFYHISLHASDFRTNGTLCVNHTTQPFIESSKKKS